MRFLRLIVSWFYGVAVTVRNLLFDEHILYSSNAPLPTICIGNLAAGGTGKTPHTEFLARELSKKYKVAILSRGYKRKTHGFYLADENSTALTIGDEPMQMYINLNKSSYSVETQHCHVSPEEPKTNGNEVIVAVCENRLYGIKRLKQLYPDLQAVILDDGMQHRQLRCGMYLLLTAADNLYVHDRFLPYGTLRDNRHSSLRANLIVVTKCPESMQPIDRRVIETSLKIPQYQQLFFSYLQYGELYPLAEGVEQKTVRKVLVLTAIANPEPMLEYLRSRYTVVKTLAFPDHHNFSGKDVENIARVYAESACDAIVTTEKDAVRLRCNSYYTEALMTNTLILPVSVDFKSQKDQFMKPVLQYLANQYPTPLSHTIPAENTEETGKPHAQL